MTKKNEESRKFNAEISKVLKLMINSLYTNKDIFLRELISNASDACDKLRYESLLNPDLLQGDSELKIDIKIDKEARTISVIDSGIGMSRDELINNLGTIAKSGTQEFIENIQSKDIQQNNIQQNNIQAGRGKETDSDSSLIGQFGVGFYSSFMVADKVIVTSRRAGSDEVWKWKSDGLGEFTIISTDESMPRGTSIILHLREGEDAYLDSFRIRHIIETYSNHIDFPISLHYDDVTDQVTKGSALWTKPKSDISSEQYKEFYQNIAHSPDDPWLIMHNKNEGKLEFTNLLFIPSIKPFDLYHNERKQRVKLYVRRVFITEENIEIIPAYLRFLRGLIDSADLPLNISRETLQKNHLISQIKEAVVKRVLSELRKKSENNENEYLAFWNNFGAVLKEGLCESHSPREQILEVCRFSTTSKENISLDDYISKMKEGQDEIYYLIGENYAALKSNPQLEGFVARGLEVVLMCDHVDDFWLNVVQEYKGKKFKSITREGINLEKFPLLDSEDKNSADKIDDNTKKQELQGDALSNLCKYMKEILGNHVADIRATHKLKSSAVCLASSEGGMDFRFERFLIEQKQLSSAMPKIMEINPKHPIIISLSKNIEKFADNSSDNSSDNLAVNSASDIIWLLFDQARILEGDAVVDQANFVRRLQELVEGKLAA